MDKKINNYFDKLEDRVRGKLSRYPIFYAFLGGIGIVLFWRGVWHIADDISLSSALSIIIGTIILLITGIFVSAFVGSKLIITGLSGEKKLVEKTEDEIKMEDGKIEKIQDTLERVEKEIEKLESEIHNKHVS